MKALLIALAIFGGTLALAQGTHTDVAPATEQHSDGPEAQAKDAEHTAPAAEGMHKSDSGGGEHAAEAHSGHHVPTEIPKSVPFQALNFFLFIALLVFLLRKAVKAFFATRHDQLMKAVREARKAQELAEQKHKEYQEKLRTLEKTANSSLEDTRREAEEYRARMIKEAKQIAANIEEEARKTADYEIARAKVQLREQAINEALEVARQAISKSIAESDQQRLQNEFVEKIRVVQQ